MSIDIHCPQCQKLIRAPDTAGGRQGKCPYCKAEVYIPNPLDDIEQIPIVPIDQEEERQADERRRDAIRYTAAIDHATDGIPQSDGPEIPQSDPEELAADVEAYIRAMHTSKLEGAQAAVTRLKQGGVHARDSVKDLLQDETSCSYKGVPPPLVQGFLRKLLAELS